MGTKDSDHEKTCPTCGAGVQGYMFRSRAEIVVEDGIAKSSSWHETELTCEQGHKWIIDQDEKCSEKPLTALTGSAQTKRSPRESLKRVADEVRTWPAYLRTTSSAKIDSDRKKG